MSTEVVVAIIAGTATVLAAIITGIFELLKKNKGKNIKIKQKQKGSNNIQIGLINREEKGDKNGRN